MKKVKAEKTINLKKKNGPIKVCVHYDIVWTLVNMFGTFNNSKTN